MIYAIAAVLILLWVAGMVASSTLAGILQVLLVIVVAITLLRLAGTYRAR